MHSSSKLPTTPSPSQFFCLICHDTVTNTWSVAHFSRCAHKFCAGCIVKWVLRNIDNGQPPTCPTCRTISTCLFLPRDRQGRVLHGPADSNGHLPVMTHHIEDFRNANWLVFPNSTPTTDRDGHNVTNNSSHQIVFPIVPEVYRNFQISEPVRPEPHSINNAMQEFNLPSSMYSNEYIVEEGSQFEQQQQSERQTDNSADFNEQDIDRERLADSGGGDNFSMDDS